MKYKQLSWIVFFLLTTTFVYPQKKSNAIYEIQISKWAKTGSGEESKIVKIDSLGRIFLNYKNTGRKVNINSLSKSVDEFIQKEHLKKIDANNNPPIQIGFTNNPVITVSISIIYLADYRSEKNYQTKSHYDWDYGGANRDDSNIFLNNYLDKNNQAILKKLLD